MQKRHLQIDGNSIAVYERGGSGPAMEDAFLPNPAMQFILSPTLTEEQATAVAELMLRPGAEPPPSFVEAILKSDGQSFAC